MRTRRRVHRRYRAGLAILGMDHDNLSRPAKTFRGDCNYVSEISLAKLVVAYRSFSPCLVHKPVGETIALLCNADCTAADG